VNASTSAVGSAAGVFVATGVLVDVATGVLVTVAVGITHPKELLEVTRLDTAASVMAFWPLALPVKVSAGETASTIYTHVNVPLVPAARLIEAPGELLTVTAAGSLAVSAEGFMLFMATVPVLFTFMVTVISCPTTPLAGTLMLEVIDPPGIAVADAVGVHTAVFVEVETGVFVGGTTDVFVATTACVGVGVGEAGHVSGQ